MPLRQTVQKEILKVAHFSGFESSVALHSGPENLKIPGKKTREIKYVEKLFS